MLVATAYALLLGAVYFDLRSRRIPNYLTLPAMGLGLLVSLAQGGLSGAGTSMLGLLLGGGLLFPLFAYGKFGGGDVKLLAAIGALRGASFVWRATLLGAASGGVLALLFLAYRRELGPVMLGLYTATYRTDSTYPYSPAIALGVLLADLGWFL